MRSVVGGELAACSVLLEPRRVRILVLPRDLFVQFQPDPRPVRHFDAAVLDDLAAVGDGLPVVAVEPVELEDEEVGHSRADMVSLPRSPLKLLSFASPVSLSAAEPPIMFSMPDNESSKAPLTSAVASASPLRTTLTFWDLSE